MGHWYAVDRCCDNYAAALAYARERLAIIEGRPVHRVEVEAVVIRCPTGHGWTSTEQPVDERETA